MGSIEVSLRQTLTMKQSYELRKMASLKIPVLYSQKQLKNKAKKLRKKSREFLWEKLHQEWRSSRRQNKLFKIKHERDKNTIQQLQNEIEKLKFEMLYENLAETSNKSPVTCSKSGNSAESSNKRSKLSGK